MSNLGKWNRWYTDLDEPQSYGSTETYRIGAEFLADCDTIEDWGCGKGFMRTLIDPKRYRGIDGSETRFADIVADLFNYRSKADGVFLRHVLEHDYRWAQILENAAWSARRKLVVVLFTPMSDKTHEIAWNEDPGVPDLSFCIDDLEAILLDKFDLKYQQLETKTQYGSETVLLCEATP